MGARRRNIPQAHPPWRLPTPSRAARAGKVPQIYCISFAPKMSSVALQFASARLADDAAVVAIACAQGGSALRHASTRLQADEGLRHIAGRQMLPLNRDFQASWRLVRERGLGTLCTWTLLVCPLLKLFKKLPKCAFPGLHRDLRNQLK